MKLTDGNEWDSASADNTEQVVGHYLIWLHNSTSAIGGIACIIARTLHIAQIPSTIIHVPTRTCADACLILYPTVSPRSYSFVYQQVTVPAGRAAVDEITTGAYCLIANLAHAIANGSGVCCRVRAGCGAVLGACGRGGYQVVCGYAVRTVCRHYATS